MRHFVSALGSAAVALGTLSAGAQEADTGRVLVELFTSQGCSSCPAADSVLAELTTDPRVLALSLHVDYWDYLGWKDSFGQARFTSRQKAYARHAGDRMIYTPQIIVNGDDRVVGSEGLAVAAAVDRHAGQPLRVRLALGRGDDGRLVIRAEAVPPTDRELRVDVVRFLPEATVNIRRGENAGKTITYHNVVTSWENVARWQAMQPFELATPASGPQPAVVVVQGEGPAEVLAVAELR
jgi:hypothetical protein